MDVMPRPQQDQSQDDPAHRTPPAGANLTNATSGGMADPRQTPFMQGVSGAANYVKNAWANSPESVSIPRAAANYFLRPANAQVPQPTSPLGAALAIAAGTRPAAPAPAPQAPAPAYLANAAGLGPTDFGHPHHAMNSPHEYSLEQFRAATAGMPFGVFKQMAAMTHQRTYQEQAAQLALAEALNGGAPSNMPTAAQYLDMWSRPAGGMFAPGGPYSTGQ